MKKRWIAVLLCAALLAAFGWGQPRISGEGETYDLYFLEADLSDAPGGDALRAEPPPGPGPGTDGGRGETGAASGQSHPPSRQEKAAA